MAEMDTSKRLLIAFVAVLVFLFLYELLLLRMTPPAPIQAPGEDTTQTAPVPPPPPVAPPALETAGGRVIPEPQPVEIRTPLFVAKFTRQGGFLYSFRLLKYRDYRGEPVELVPPGQGFFGLTFPGSDTLRFEANLEGGTLESTDSLVLELRASTPQGPIVKRFLFRGSHYLVDFSLQIPVGEERETFLTFPEGLNLTEKNQKEDRSYAALLLYERKLKKFPLDKIKESLGETADDALWVGLRTKYFLLALFPQPPGFKRLEATRHNNHLQVGISFVGPELSSRIYLGPIDYFILKDLGYGLTDVVDFGFSLFAPFAKGILYLMRFFHTFIPNYGLVIILLSFLMKLVFWPLSRKSLQAMRKMQELKPEMEKIQKLYKDDPQRMQREMMELYRKHKVNPFSGCLPLLLQLPVFWALYQILRTSIELRGAPFLLWIQDLSTKDPYYVLPILMGAASFLQAYTQPQADKQSRMLAYFMPIFLTVLFLNFPAGIVLYWLTYNVFTLLEQLFLKRGIRKKEESDAVH